MKSYQEVYKILTTEKDYVSGEKIADVLNLSRTSVWKAIKRLQQEGLEIDSIKNRISVCFSAKMPLQEKTLFVTNISGHRKIKSGR